MKRILLPLAMAAVVVASLMGRPPTAVALGCPLWAYFFAPSFIGCTVTDMFGATFTVAAGCPLTQVNVSATNGGNGHRYDYVLSGDCKNVHITGGYDVTAKNDSETLSGGGRTITAVWTCSEDPWIYAGGAPSCTRIRASLSGNTQGVDTSAFSSASFPMSSTPLSDTHRHALYAQLQNAIKQLN